jgi:hypothetical protein
LTLTPGTRLGVYTITTQIGVGGMGEVYRATDSNLKRSVAIKVLPAAVAGDADRLTRFQREAEVLAALNHPNIAAIYGLEKTAEFTALVMELVEGEDLSQRIAKGPLPPSEALPIAKQIAEALEAAHEQRIIHRDLKPANVKVREDGTVKVLDFGLAKAMDPVAAGRVIADSPTMTSPALMTGVGVLLGTAAYMAPEQARGKTADRRSDIWAFGVVLYEMFAGRRPFPEDHADDTVAQVLARVLEREPQWSALPANLSPRITGLLRRCLEKDPKRRLQAIGEARIAIDDSLRGGLEAETVPRIASRSRIRYWVAGGAVLLLALAFGGLSAALVNRHTTNVSNADVARVQLVLPPGVRFERVGLWGGSHHLALSSDGKELAFVATDSEGHALLWVRPLRDATAHAITGTAGATFPFWSPSGNSVAFFANGKLKRVQVSTGAVRTITDAPDGLGGSWSTNDTILFVPRAQSRPLLISADGGAATPVGDPGVLNVRFPTFLSDGKRFVVTSAADVFLGSTDSSQFTRLTDGNGAQLVTEPDGNTGYLVFASLSERPSSPITVSRWPARLLSAGRCRFRPPEHGDRADGPDAA